MTSKDNTWKTSVDAAVAKELKRRELIVRCLWGLILLAFMLTGWIAYKVNRTAPLAAQKLSSDPKFVDATANTLASQKDIQEGVSSRAASLLSQDKQFLAQISNEAARDLGSSPGFVGKAADELERNNGFLNRIAKAVHQGEPKYPSQEILASSLSQVQDLQSKLQERLSSLEQKFSDIQQQLEVVKNAEEQHQRNITDIIGQQKKDLEESQATQLLELKRDFDAFKKEQPELSQMYLLKTSQWNDLTGLDIKVKLGHKIGETISEFAIQRGNELCELKLAVHLGKPFICDIGTSQYRIELVYVVTRFIVKDYVGMKIELVQSN